MFNNIGAKIKVLAQVWAWIGIIVSVIVGFYLIIQGSGVHRGGGGEVVGVGIGILIGGALWSWISSWGLYGFGELIEKTTEIAKNTAKDSAPNPLMTKMETLIQWRDSNLISEEEFEIKKQALLKGE